MAFIVLIDKINPSLRGNTPTNTSLRCLKAFVSIDVLVLNLRGPQQKATFRCRLVSLPTGEQSSD